MSITGLTEFAIDRIFQRVGAWKTVVFAGTYGTAPGFMDIRLLAEDGSTVVQDWTAATLDSASGGNWTATFSVPQGGWYRWQARDQDGASAVSARKFGVGALVLCIGQSNMRRMWGTRVSPPAAHALTRRWAGFGWFANDLTAQGGESSAWHGTTYGGNGAVVLANELRAGLGLPVGLLQLAVEGSEVARWFGSGDCRANLDTMLTADVGTDFEAALWHQGEADVSAAISYEDYSTRLGNVIAEMRSLSGRPSLPFGIAILGRRTGGGMDAANDRVRLAQRDVAAATPGAFIAGSSLDMALSDSVHWDAPSYERMGRRYAQSVMAALGVASSGAAGPRIAGVTRQRGTAAVVVSVQHEGGSALREVDNTTDGGGLTGFTVLRNGVPLTISSTAFVGGAVELTLSAAPNGGALTLTYQAGSNPDVANPVHDDAPPAGDARGVPLQPSYAALPVVATGESIMSGSGVSLFGSFVLPAATVADDRWLFRLDDGTDGNALGAVVPGGSANIVPRVIRAGVATDGAAAGTVAAATPRRVSLVVGADSLRVCVDGAEPVVQAHDLTGLTQFRLGGQVAGGAALAGECGGLRMLRFAASDAGQAALTAILP